MRGFAKLVAGLLILVALASAVGGGALASDTGNGLYFLIPAVGAILCLAAAVAIALLATILERLEENNDLLRELNETSK